MRVSVDKDDEGYVIDSSLYEVQFNGKLINNCITADEEKGFCLVYSKKNNGNYAIIGDAIAKKIIYGDVKLIHNLRINK